MFMIKQDFILSCMVLLPLQYFNNRMWSACDKYFYQIIRRKWIAENLNIAVPTMQCETTFNSL